MMKITNIIKDNRQMISYAMINLALGILAGLGLVGMFYGELLNGAMMFVSFVIIWIVFNRYIMNKMQQEELNAQEEV